MTQMVGVAVALLLLGAALWWLRRAGLVVAGTLSRGGDRVMAERVGRLRLGPHHSVELVRLADSVLVVAVHNSGCTLLRTMHWSEFAPAETARAAEAGR